MRLKPLHYLILTHIALVLIIVLMCFDAKAGAFLDLDLATPINNYNSTACIPSGTATVYPQGDNTYRIEYECEGGRYLGDSGTLGIVRLGYQTKAYKLGPVSIGAHAYYMHVSDWRMSDGGLDVIAAGLRIQ